jgi:hypothetical protein
MTAMPRTTSLVVCATLLCAFTGCGDPKNAAGAIGTPAQNNKAQKVVPAEQKIAPAEQKIAPVEQKVH